VEPSGANRINVDQTAGLWRMLSAAGNCNDEERTFLHELSGEVGRVSRAFAGLLRERIKQPPEQRATR
jgi:hypothetical protein